MDGYAGSILYVDLTKESTETKETPHDLKRLYLGGRGFWERVRGGCDITFLKVDPEFCKVIIPETGIGRRLYSHRINLSTVLVQCRGDKRYRRRRDMLQPVPASPSCSGTGKPDLFIE